MGLGPSAQVFSSAPGRVVENLYIAGLVHVGEEPGDGNVPDGLLEEHLLYGGRADRAERRQEQEQLPEAAGLSGVPETHHLGSQKQPFLSLALRFCCLTAACSINAHL